MSTTLRSRRLGTDPTLIIAGATGFIGRRLARSCSQRAVKLLTAARSATRPETLSPGNYGGNRHVTTNLIRSDGAAELFRNLQTETALLVHLVGDYNSHDPSVVVDANLYTLLNILEEADKAPTKLEHIIFASSVAVYGLKQVRHREGGERGVRPDTAYGKAKWLAEEALSLYSESTKTPVGILRIASVYGTGNPRRNLITSLVDTARRGGPLRIAPHAEPRDYIHVDDVVSAIELATSERFAGVADIGSGRPVTPLGVAQMINAIRGSNLDIVRDPTLRALAGQVCDTTVAWEQFGFRPRVDLVSGVTQILSEGDRTGP